MGKLHETIHGANPENLYRAFNIEPPEKIIDFSTNTNIISWPEIKIDVAALASCYPDCECARLREIISQREKISPEKILFTNGINEAIFLLARIFGERYAKFKQGDDAQKHAAKYQQYYDGDAQKNFKPTNNTAILQPNYSEYARAFPNAQDIFSLDDAKNFAQIIITNPANPTGNFIPDLSRVIAECPGTTFIIDEAYIDFLLYEKRERLCDFPNVIILRSLTKIYPLSGARIGYVIADKKIIDALKKLLPTWSVNSFAQELAIKFLSDKDFYERTRKFYVENTPRFMKELRAAGFEVAKSAVHFFLVRVDDDIEAIKFLLRYGIVARHTRNFKGIDAGKYIRVATRLPDENKFFVEAMTLSRAGRGFGRRV